MLTVSNNSGLVFDPCPGKTLISVYVTLNPAQDYCGEGTPSTINVYVVSSTPSIQASVAAGNPIYSESDCTICAQTGYYQDINSSNPNVSHYFKGCAWNAAWNCTARTQATVRVNSSRNPLCDNVGTLVSVYLDNSYTAQEGFTTNNIYTTNAIYGNATTNDPPSIINPSYLRTTNLSLEEEHGVWTRLWNPNFGGIFSAPEECMPEIVDPPTYYSFEVHKTTSWTPADVCDAPTYNYYLLEGTYFSDGTRLFSNDTGTYAPNGYYKNAGTGVQPIPDNPEDNTSNSVFQISGGDGILTLTAATCGRRGDIPT